MSDVKEAAGWNAWNAHPAVTSLRCTVNMNAGAPQTATRVDRWLWAARAFRSRSLAAQACDGGKVTVNGASAKPHKLIRVGDRIEITVRSDRRQWRVVELSERRGPAPLARSLYEDLTPPPRPEPTDPGMPHRERGSGRPTKRERRRMAQRW